MGQRARTAGSVVGLVAVTALVAWWLDGRDYRSSAGLHAGVEVVGGIIGLIAGGALLARFRGQGRRVDLLAGLAFLVNGASDLIHGGLPLAIHVGWRPEDPDLVQAFIPSTYATGRTLMAALLLAAAARGYGHSDDPRRAARLGGGAAIAIGLLTTLVYAVLLPRVVIDLEPISRPVDAASALLFLIATAALLDRWWGERDLLLGWLVVAAAASAVGQGAMATSILLYDAPFDFAHAMKVLSYALPLAAFVVGQARTIERERLQRAELEATAAELRRTVARLEHAATAVSHDLRGPLTALIGLLELAGRAEGGVRTRLLARARAAAERLDILIEDLVAEVRGTPRDTPVPVAEVLEEVEEVLAPMLEEAGATLEVGGPLPAVRIGRAALRSLLTNLLTNAVRYRRPGRGVRIRLSATAEGPDRVHLVVADDGRGIPPEHRDAVLEGGVRLDPEVPGTGVGLATLRGLVEAAGGRMWLDDGIDGGLAVHVVLPGTLPAASPVPTPAGPAARGRSGRTAAGS